MTRRCGYPKAPQGFHRATIGRVAGFPKATLRLPYGYPKAPTGREEWAKVEMEDRGWRKSGRGEGVLKFETPNVVSYNQGTPKGGECVLNAWGKPGDCGGNAC